MNVAFLLRLLITMNQTTLDFYSDEDIFVLDTETTGLHGAPRDVVVDIAVCRVSLSEGTVEPIYSSVVGHDTSKWDDSKRRSWIFENTDMTLEMIDDAPPFEQVHSEVSDILRDNSVTSYNTDYDMDKFLYPKPWGFKGLFTLRKDIMKAAMYVCKLPSQYYHVEYRYPRLEHAYSVITENDPAGIEGVQDHRALSDAIVASHVMIQMYRDGTYSP